MQWLPLRPNAQQPVRLLHPLLWGFRGTPLYIFYSFQWLIPTVVPQMHKSKDNSSAALPPGHALVALRSTYPLAPCPMLLQGRLVDGVEIDTHHMYGGEYREQCCALCKAEETCVAYHVDLRDVSAPTCTLFSSVRGEVDVGNPAVFAAVPQRLP